MNRATVLDRLHALPAEARGGMLLAAAAALAMVAANVDGLDRLYRALLDVPVEVRIADLVVAKPLLLWINDGLMALFFLLVGIEIKREAVEGALSDIRVAALPMIAAAGGVILPVLVHVAITMGDPVALRGWAIPAATDIAFALGVAALLGRYFPALLRLFLLTLAIVDDLAAIIIIALFFTDDLSTSALVVSAVAIALLVVLNLRGTTRIAPFVVVGACLWVAVLKSGVHATLAGVVVGLLLPLRDRDGGTGPAHECEHGLQPWVTWLILPLFAFANAGVSLVGITPATAFAPLPIAIALGLLLGKQAGVYGACRLAVALGWARLPDGVDWRQLYGAAVLTGIGFTMSLFIGNLAYASDDFLDQVRLGVLAGSIGAALWGTLWLRCFATRG